MSAPAGSLLLPLEHDAPAPIHTAKPWWTLWKTRVAYVITDNAGLLLVICSQSIFASANIVVKLLQALDPPTPTLELMTLRMVISACCCMTYTLANRVPDPILGPKDVRWLLVARALFGFLGIFGMYYSLNYLSVADATVITFLGPFAVALAGHVLLGETYSAKEAIAAVCSLVGVVLIARPTFLFGDTVGGEGGPDATSFERLRAVGAALGGVVGNSGTFITMRAIGTRAHPMHVMTFFSLFSILFGCTMILTTGEAAVFPMTWSWIVLLLLVGFLSVIGQLLLTLGLHYETATRSSLAQYYQLLFAAVLQFVVFGTVPTPLSVAGAAIIMAAQAFAVFAKQKQMDSPSVTATRLRNSDDVHERLLSADDEDVSSDTELPLGKADAREGS